MKPMTRVCAEICMITTFVCIAHVTWAAAPVALVEDVSGGAVTLQPLDYVSEGQVVDLGKSGRMTLGYLESCVHEEIGGGLVIVGGSESRIENGSVSRRKVECDGGRLLLSVNQAMQSGATAVRDINPKIEPKVTVYDTRPMFLLPKTGRVVVKRVDKIGERYTVKVAPSDAKARLDFADENISLIPGGVYMVSVGGLSQTFRVAIEAKHEAQPLLSRLVTF